ncbi:MAG: hypothetical protein ACRC3Y_06945 [Romboutsia sp.]|uniref:hypothetical protein n=1 Tax=Romboutsia sp. TaxID=1965302 RepID=UPI003F3898FC
MRTEKNEEIQTMNKDNIKEICVCDCGATIYSDSRDMTIPQGKEYYGIKADDEDIILYKCSNCLIKVYI